MTVRPVCLDAGHAGGAQRGAGVSSATGRSATMRSSLLEAATALSDDAACLQYLVSTFGDADVCVFEIWRDEAAHNESLLREDVRAIVDVAAAADRQCGFAGTP